MWLWNETHQDTILEAKKKLRQKVMDAHKAQGGEGTRAILRSFISPLPSGRPSPIYQPCNCIHLNRPMGKLHANTLHTHTHAEIIPGLSLPT